MGVFRSKKIISFMEEHIECTQKAISKLGEFFTVHMTNGCSSSVDSILEEINAIERTGDSIRRSVVREFIKGSMLPQTRKEVLNLIEKNDDLINIVQEISRQVCVEQIEIKEEFSHVLIDIINETKEQVVFLSTAIEYLFADYQKLAKEDSILDDINACEHKIDLLEIELIRKIYSSDITLAHKIQLKRLVASVASISDRIEDIGDKIQVFLVFRM